MDEFTRRRWERIAEECCERAYQAALQAVHINAAIQHLPDAPVALRSATAGPTPERSTPLQPRGCEH